MTATYELRAMLNKLGVEWKAGCVCPDRVTTFVTDGIEWRYFEGIDWHDGEPPLCWLDTEPNVTPQQAIDATLGRGECRMEQTCHERIAGFDAYHDEFMCSECGGDMFEGYNFCPSCGAKVVGE